MSNAVVSFEPPPLPDHATPGERALAEKSIERIRAATADLTPATGEEKRAAIRKLLVNMPSPAAANDATAEERFEGYAIALEGVSALALSGAVTALVNGSAGATFMPSPPELGRIVRAREELPRAALDRAHRDFAFVRECAWDRLPPAAKEPRHVQA